MNLFCLFRGIRKSHHRLVVKYSGGPNLSSHEITRCRNESSSIGPMTQIAEFVQVMTRDHIRNVLDTIFKKVLDQGQADLMLEFFFWHRRDSS